ncbi:MAG TPA: metal-dependent hydrolase [Dehalococcoidia bacterium]|nr:metal-dependent hydrolase [Dehalococcoidia bacterium]
MLLFGHIGITLAATALGFRLTDKLRNRITEDRVGGSSPTSDSSHLKIQPDNRMSFFRSLANHVDIRFLLVGSMLPDIIDKPVGIFLFQETYSNGRIFSHTLLFLILLMVAGLFIRGYSGKTWGLALSIGTVFHLLLDKMWQTPKTLFWPILGFGFEKTETFDYLSKVFYVLLNEPAVYIPEIIGFIAFVLFAWELLNRRITIKFLQNGRLY